MTIAARRPGVTSLFLAEKDADKASLAAQEASAPLLYVGLATRAIAITLDFMLIQVVALIVTAVTSLALSVLNMPQQLRDAAIAIGGVVYVLWTIGYFVFFWSTTGQTPGSRVMRIRVRAVHGERLLPRRALLRFGALTLAALPLGAGLFVCLISDRRRCLQDWVARTVVVEHEDEAAMRRRERRGG